MLLYRWIRSRVTKNNVEKENMCAVAATGNNPFAGSVPAVFRSAIHAWMKIYGVLPVVGLAGSVPIAAV